MKCLIALRLVNGVDFRGMKLVVERPWLYTVSVNGDVIEPLRDEYWLDPDFYLFDVEKQMKKGENIVSLVADPFSVNCETEPVYLLGKFALEPSIHGFRMVPSKALKPGSWRAQGMPFYGQSVKYSKKVHLQKAGRIAIELPDWSGTVAAVNINGREAGIIQAPPYVLNADLEPGETVIDVIVIGSLKNTLGPHHVVYPNGVGGRPVNFINAPLIQPGGNAYSLIDYGLMSDFKVYLLE